MTKKKKAPYDDRAAIRTIEKAISQRRNLGPVLKELFSGMETLAEFKVRAAKKPRTKK